jgi:predicted DNA-binding protein
MDKPTSIRFPEDEKKRILEEAKKEGRSLAGFVRFHIKQMISDRKTKMKSRTP